MFLEEGGEIGRWSSDGAQCNRKWLHWGLRQAPVLTKCLLHTHIYTRALHNFYKKNSVLKKGIKLYYTVKCVEEDRPIEEVTLHI